MIAKRPSALTVMKNSKRDLFNSLSSSLCFFQVTVNFKDAALSPGYAGMREKDLQLRVGFFCPPDVYELRLRRGA